MGAPTIYYYNDPGAPVISSRQDAFYQIVMACCVNGYGAKPAAGWSVVYDQWAAHGHASFSNESQSGVLGLVRNTAADAGAFLYIAEAMVDYQAAINARSGHRSSINPATLASSSSAANRQRAHSAPFQRWVCIADEFGAWVFFGDTDARLFNPWSTSQDHTLYSSIYIGSYRNFFGAGERSAPLLGNFIILGGVCDVQSNFIWYVVGTNSTLLHNKNGLLASDGTRVGLYPFACNGSSFFVGVNSADSFSQFPLARAQIFDAGVSSNLNNSQVIGEMPMLYTSWELAAGYSSNHGRTFSRRIQPTGDAFKTEVLISGKRYITVPMGNLSYGLMSLEAEDWN